MAMTDFTRFLSSFTVRVQPLAVQAGPQADWIFFLWLFLYVFCLRLSSSEGQVSGADHTHSSDPLAYEHGLTVVDAVTVLLPADGQ